MTRTKTMKLAVIVVTLIAALALVVGCGGNSKPTLESYFDKNKSEWDTAVAQIQESGQGVMDVDMSVKGNHITQVMTYKQTFGNDAVEMMRNTFAGQVEGLASNVGEQIKSMEKAANIEGITWTFEYRNGNGDLIYGFDVDSKGVASNIATSGAAAPAASSASASAASASAASPSASAAAPAAAMTLESYFAAHPDEWAAVESSLESSGDETFDVGVAIEGNHITQTMTLKQTVGSDQAASFKSTLEAQSDSLVSELSGDIKNLEQEAGISGIVWTVEVRNGNGDEIFSIDVEGK